MHSNIPPLTAKHLLLHALHHIGSRAAYRCDRFRTGRTGFQWHGARCTFVCARKASQMVHYKNMQAFATFINTFINQARTRTHVRGRRALRATQFMHNIQYNTTAYVHTEPNAPICLRPQKRARRDESTTGRESAHDNNRDAVAACGSIITIPHPSLRRLLHIRLVGVSSTSTLPLWPHRCHCVACTC